MNVRILAAAVLACMLVPFARAAAADFPVPPRPQTMVVDRAGALSDTARTQLETELRAFESSTGHHVVVYIGQTTGNVPLETWTVETANAWKVGQKGKDDGAILFVFMQDHKVRIEVGYGLESLLPDASASQIILNTIVPRMKNGDTDGAVTAGVAAMLTTIDPKFTPSATPAQSAPEESSSTPAPDWIVALVVLFILFVAFCIVMQIYTAIRYGFLIMREGKEAALRDMRRSWLHFFMTGGGGVAIGGMSFGGGGGGGGGGFSGGSFGGSFGGGGASGSW